MSLAPYFPNSSNLNIWLLIYTIAFFAIALYLSLRPNKLVDTIGKFMTPILLALIGILFLGAVIKIPVNIGTTDLSYNNPIMKGFVEGYNTMDGLVSINFGVVILFTINNYNIKKESDKIKYTTLAGIVSGSILFIIYTILAYIGMITSGTYEGINNGGIILFNVTNEIFGVFGLIVLALIFTLACVTTVVGLITSVGDYFAKVTNTRYTFWAILFTLISLVLSNFGLNEILKFSVPILVVLNPIAMVIILLTLLQDIFKFRKISYKLTIYTTAIIALSQGLNAFGLNIEFINNIFSKLPLYEYSLEWIIPSFIVLLISLVIGKVFNTKKI